MENHFTVTNRNYGHWDIWNKNERLFRIRGGPGRYCVIGDHSKNHIETQYFKTVQACMSYITDDLMFELIIADGQEPQIIESWNI